MTAYVVHGERICDRLPEQTYVCEACGTLTCWCSGGDLSDFCDDCFFEPSRWKNFIVDVKKAIGLLNSEKIVAEQVTKNLIRLVNDGSIKKGLAILWFVFLSNEKGRKFSEIQRFICEMNGRDFDKFMTKYEIRYDNGRTFSYHYDPDEVEEINGYLFMFYKVGGSFSVSRIGKIISKKDTKTRVNRGYGCTWLLGSYEKRGLLEGHCHKKDGRWFLSDETREKMMDKKKFVLTPSRFHRDAYAYWCRR